MLFCSTVLLDFGKDSACALGDVSHGCFGLWFHEGNTVDDDFFFLSISANFFGNVFCVSSSGTVCHEENDVWLWVHIESVFDREVPSCAVDHRSIFDDL